MARKVKRLNGTSDNTCRCANWLEHWARFGGGRAGYCAEDTCAEKAEVGACVQKDANTDQSCYIIPLCREHGTAGGSLEIMDFTVLVPADTKTTCMREGVLRENNK